MTDTPKAAGLPEGFNLADHANPGSMDDISLPDASEAANRVLEKFNTDPLTGLMNATAWKAKLDESITNLQPGEGITVYVVDADKFKNVNDTLGHSAGDELLGFIGQALQKSFKRKTDAITRRDEAPKEPEGIARWGGDEFAVYSINKTVDASNHRTTSTNEEITHQSELINQNLQELLSGTKFAEFGVSLSVGSTIFQPGDSVQTLFDRADQNMLKDKQTGRNGEEAA